MSIARAKKLDGSPIEFVFEDKGLLSHETQPTRCPPDFPPAYVTMFVIDGKRVWSSVPNGQDVVNRRFEADSVILRAHGIDPETIDLSDAA